MSEPNIDTTIAAPENVPPVSNEEAAKIVQDDTALREAGNGNDADMEDDADPADSV